MSAVWTAVKKSLDCKSNQSEVHEPKHKTKSKNNSWCKPKSRRRRNAPSLSSSSSSKSCKSAFKDVIHGSRRFKETSAATNRSPLSIKSSDLINPVTHHVRFTKSDLKITKTPPHDHNSSSSFSKCFIESPTSRPNSDGFGSFSTMPNELVPELVSESSSRPRRLSIGESSAGGQYGPACHKCGEPLARQDAEEHHLSKHAVTEILEGNTSRKVVEMIFMAGWTNSENRGRIGRILKVHNPQTKIAVFEEYRELVKIRANRLQHTKKHPRLLADGNELLRFYGTTVACSLGKKGSSSLCTLQICNVCSILRHGFSTQDRTSNHSVLGIFTSSTSEGAYRSIENGVEEKENHNKVLKKALIVCRAIAGRVHRPTLENVHELFVGGRRSGFDSLAGNLGTDSNHIEELYLLKPSALLPCFVIICKH